MSLSTEATEYYAALTAAVGNRIRVTPIPNKGKGVLVTTPCKEDDFVFAETPLGSLQHASNRAISCANCRRFIGTLENQLSELLTVKLNAAQKAQIPMNEQYELLRKYGSGFPDIPSGFILPYIDNSKLTDVIPCANECGNQYCSISCRDSSWRRHHSMLCPGPAIEELDVENENVSSAAAGGHHHHHHGHDHDHDHEHSDEDMEDEEDEEDEMENDDEDHDGDEILNAAALFQSQAYMTNEIFLMAGQAYCRILESWARNGNDLFKAMLPYTVLHTQPWSELFALQSIGAERKAAILGDDDDENKDDNEEDDDILDVRGPSEFSISNPQAHPTHALADPRIKEWCADSLAILRKLIQERLASFVDLTLSQSSGDRSKPLESRRELNDFEMDTLFSLDFYERLIGAFELNNIELKVDSPLRSYLEMLREISQRKYDTERLSDPNLKFADVWASIIAPLSLLLRQVAAARTARAAMAAAIRDMIGDDDCDAEDELLDVDPASTLDYESNSEAENFCNDVFLLLPRDAHGPTLRIPMELFPVCNGTCLMALTCCCNHSCRPNSQLMYFNGDCTGALVALRDLAEGEEVTINYVDMEQERALRQADLCHYGFECNCERCLEEASE